MAQSNPLKPTNPFDRYPSLDILRGVAVLGILIMNIQSFSMPEAAYLNPSAFGDLTGLNKWTWMISHIFADQKFMTIFSILFGAGIILMSHRAEDSGRRPAVTHYKRIFWLFVIGMLHAYLIWHGDILVTYAVCGTIVFLFRKLNPLKLVVIGILLISVSSLLYLFFGWSIQFWPQDAIDNTMLSWKPAAELINREIAAFRGSWLDQMPYRIKASLTFQTMVFFIFTGWRVSGLMLIGMALYKWGVLTANRSNKFYLFMFLIGFTLGLPVVISGMISNINADFSLKYAMFTGSQFNYWASIFISMGYIGLIMFLYQKMKKNLFFGSMADIGRTAFSNYILQSILCTFIFYGHGLGLFARIERKYQILFVLLVWFVQISLTELWVRLYKFGPVEWLWRSLIYGQRQPLKLSLKEI